MQGVKMNTKRIVIYRDGTTPVDAIKLINSMCGMTVESPRPDLIGRFIVVDIVSVDIVQISNSMATIGYGACAVVDIVPEVQQEEISTFLGISKEIMDAPFT